MFKNYLKIAWRNLLRRKFYSAINIFGLSIGVAFVFLVGSYVWGEWQVNRNFKNADRLFLLQTVHRGSEGIAAAPSPFAQVLKETYPHLVSNFYRSFWKNTIISNGEKHFRDNVQVGDSTLIDMFGFSLLYGNPGTLFDSPDAVVITEERALKFFGSTNSVGKTLTIQNTEGQDHDFIVTGILKDIPANSINTVRANAKIPVNSVFLSVNGVKQFYKGGDFLKWQAYSNSYVELKEGVNPADLVQPIHQLINTHVPGENKEGLQISLKPLSNYHLDANNGIVRKIIYTLSLTALFILLMAIVNFVNMSIASSMARLKEIGLRKVMGGIKRQLILQFLIEATIISFIAVGFSLLIYQLIQPFTATLLGKEFPQLSSMPFYFICIPVVLILCIGLLAGTYPALVLSSVNTVESVKGKLKGVKENIFLRKALVSFQFFIAIVVFISAVVIARQVHFFLNTDLGFHKDQVLNVELPRNWTEAGVKRIQTIRNEIAASKGVVQASVSFSIPNRNTTGSPGFYKSGNDPLNVVEPSGIIADEKYAETFGIPVIAGSFFSRTNTIYDSSAIVVNEAFTKALGWKSANEAVGKKLSRQDNNESYTICGVVKDFHFESKQEAIKPLVIFHIQSSTIFRFMSIRLESLDMEQTIAGLEKKWMELMPGSPFDYSFMDETINTVYKSEIQLKKASYFATILAVVIVMLGIIGMVSLSIAKRTREIGIRKILGSSVSGIILFFIRDIFRAILVANLIAWPVSYFIMKKWLSDYAYRIEMGLYPFIIVSVLLTIATMLLISIQTTKVAIKNPVKSLRTE
ncbi:ABC transporter permease [Terrimonas pollutisoli]|uniref:ABC transporter permease n=1 Tax=Terrimonas pollutisoli TaxID=3034147 RepID=UPI0023EC953B|nr:ABC transporter permease [Terrimonas sp. H1YJ31]